jgi:hypothetical protein
MYIVTFTAVNRQGFDVFAGPMAFAFDDESEASQFASHVQDLYGYGDVVMAADTTHTYDSAIQALVEAIGPSED